MNGLFSMNSHEKRAETKAVKELVTRLGFGGVRVTHGAYGWLDIDAHTFVTGCNCNMGVGGVWGARCEPCSTTWENGYRLIKDEVKNLTGRTGEYDGYIQVMLRLEKQYTPWYMA